MEENESWNMASAYYFRIDQILTYCVGCKMKGEGRKWYNGLSALYDEVEAKMDNKQRKEAEDMYDELTKMINEGKKEIPTIKFKDFERFLRRVLEKKGMLTPKRDTSGL